MTYPQFSTRFLIFSLYSFSFILSAVAEEDLHNVYNFVTRPELKAPRWSIDVYEHDLVSPGYWFMSPYEQIGQTEPGRGWIGPHIYDGRGELVWSGAEMFGNMSVMDFRVSKVHGQHVMSLVRPELRSGMLLNNNYDTIRELPIEGFNMHDLNFVDGGEHALVITRGVFNSTEQDARTIGLEQGQCEANFHGIVELDAETWEPTWNWTAFGHIGLDESTMAYGDAASRCKGGSEWDYMHANAVDKCPDGDYLLSARHTDTIYKISRRDGSIIWRLGGKNNDFGMKGLNFSRQHDVRCRAQNDTHTTISFLDNAKGEDPQTPTSEYSRGLMVSLDTEKMEASIVSQYDHPEGPGGYSFRRGDVQVLENNNVFIGWSEHALHTEHTADGKLILKAEMLAHWVGTYRSYKFPFVGRPLAPPDVHSQAFDSPSAEANNSTSTLVHVSWNGATEVATWKLYKTDPTGAAAREILSVPRAGFETALVHAGFASHVFVEALDAHGTSLGVSNIIRTIEPENVLTPAVAEELLWLQRVAEGLRYGGENGGGGADGQLAGFAFGFACCAFLSGIVFGFWAIWSRGVRLRVRLPWRHDEREYQCLTEKPGRRAPVSEEC